MGEEEEVECRHADIWRDLKCVQVVIAGWKWRAQPRRSPRLGVCTPVSCWPSSGSEEAIISALARPRDSQDRTNSQPVARYRWPRSRFLPIPPARFYQPLPFDGIFHLTSSTVRCERFVRISCNDEARQTRARGEGAEYRLRSLFLEKCETRCIRRIEPG